MTENGRGQYRFGPGIYSNVFQFIAALLVAAYSSLHYMKGRGDFITLAYFVIALLYMGLLIRLRKNPPVLSIKEEGLSIPKNLLKHTFETCSFESIKDIKFEKNGYIIPALKIIRNGKPPLEIRKDQLSPEDFFKVYNTIETRINKPEKKSFEEFAKEHYREKNIKIGLNIFALLFLFGISAFAIVSLGVLPPLAQITLYLYLTLGHLIITLMTKRIRNPEPEVAIA